MLDVMVELNMALLRMIMWRKTWKTYGRIWQSNIMNVNSQLLEYRLTGDPEKLATHISLLINKSDTLDVSLGRSQNIFFCCFLRVRTRSWMRCGIAENSDDADYYPDLRKQTHL